MHLLFQPEMFLLTDEILSSSISAKFADDNFSFCSAFVAFIKTIVKYKQGSRIYYHALSLQRTVFIFFFGVCTCFFLVYWLLFTDFFWGKRILW